MKKWKDLTKQEKIKKIAKYLVNALNMINMLIVGLAKIFNWNVDIINEVIILLTGVISYYLVQGKLFAVEKEDEVEVI